MSSMWDDMIEAEVREDGERVHSRFAPSALKRILACPRSVVLAEAVAPGAGRGSVYAAEGSVAHTVAEMYLRGDVIPPTYIVGAIVVHEGFEIAITAEMHQHGREYRDYVRGLMLIPESRGADDQLFIENTVSLDAIVGVDANMYGHLDAAIWSPSRKLLIIVDYKYGRGVKVSAIDNDQLKAYALGAMHALDADPRVVETVETHVFQPRVPSPGGFDTMSGAELLTWGRGVLAPVVSLIMQDGAQHKPYTTGDHCRFCPAKAQCPALRDRAVKAAQKAFEDKPIPPSAHTDDEIADFLDEWDVIEVYGDALHAEALRRAEAGNNIRGRKVVPSRGKRVWNDDVDSAALQAVVPFADIYEPRKFKTVAQLEKVVPADRLGVFNDLWTSKSSGNSLVKTSDTRKPVARPAHEVFKGTPINQEQ
jgi:hypothetical protein